MHHRLTRAGAAALLVLGACASLTQAATSTAPKAGQRCAPADQQRSVAGLRCTRQGGVLRWTVTTTTKPRPNSSVAAASATTRATTTVASPGPPARGGKLMFGNTTESVGGYTPQLSTLGPSGQMVRSLVIETLTQPDPDGDIHCWLCDTITPNSTSTEWTIKLRPNIAFHDGSPLDAAAVKLNLDEGRKASSATVSTLRSVSSVEVVDNLTVRVRVDSPWVSFPANLTQQAGAIAAPSQLRDPNGRSRPVGTGPFRFKEWVSNDHLTVVRNDSYWRKGLPYLDEITFRPIIEESSRLAALQSGDIDAILTSTGETVAQLRELAGRGRARTSEATRWASVNNIAFNNMTGPTADPRVRKALQLATDRNLINRVVHGGTHRLADSPFGDNGVARDYWPKLDTARAKSLIDQVVAQTGRPVELTLTTQPGADTVGQAELLQSLWKAIGVNAKISVIETGSGAILQRAQYQVIIGGPLLSSVDPDEMRRYFYSDDTPVGQVSGNWTRTSNGIIDTAFDQIRTNSDPAVRARAADVISRELAEQAHTLFTTQAVYAVGTSSLIAFAKPTLPDGGEWWPFPTGIAPLAFAYRT